MKPGVNPGDIVTLVDGRRGVLQRIDRDGDYCVKLENDGDKIRCFKPSLRHFRSELPNILSILPPGASMTTPYDTEIANAEKALADLKAKAIAEAAKPTQPAMKAGQRWRTAGGNVVVLRDHTISSIPVVKFVVESGLWYCADHRTHNHYIGCLEPEATLVELLGEVTRRWYTEAEMLTFAFSLPAFWVIRNVSNPQRFITGRVRVISGPTWLVYLDDYISNVDARTFKDYEYSTNGTDWKKFGIEE